MIRIARRLGSISTRTVAKGPTRCPSRPTTPIGRGSREPASSKRRACGAPPSPRRCRGRALGRFGCPWEPRHPRHASGRRSTPEQPALGTAARSASTWRGISTPWGLANLFSTILDIEPEHAEQCRPASPIICAANVRVSLLKAFEALSCCCRVSTCAKRRANVIDAMCTACRRDARARSVRAATGVGGAGQRQLGLEERCAVRVGKMMHAHFRRRSCRRCLVLFRLFCGAKAGKGSAKGSPKSSEVGTEPNNLSHHARCYSDVILALAKAELARREAH